MADNRTKEQRSYNMSRIKSTNTKPEILVRKFLFANGFRFRLHSKLLPGKPDIILPKYNTIIFIHGCFWHGHDMCINAKKPASNQNFWMNKIATNKLRDNKNIGLLKESGWKVIVLWECDLDKKNAESSLNNLLQNLKTKYR